MDHADHTIRLYSAQSAAVYEAIRRDGGCFSRAEYVQRKYQESAPIFLTAYRWFAREGERFVPKPDGAELPYWAFEDPGVVPQSGGCLLTLDVPADQVILFDMYDWNKIMQLRYIGQSQSEERLFHQELEACGLNENQVMLRDFYPEYKRRIMESWKALFRHHDALLEGGALPGGQVQAGLWTIKSQWIADARF